MIKVVILKYLKFIEFWLTQTANQSLILYLNEIFEHELVSFNGKDRGKIYHQIALGENLTQNFIYSPFSKILDSIQHVFLKICLPVKPR